MDPAIKKLEKKVFRCEADAEEELKRFEKEPGMRLHECKYTTEKQVKEKWPRGRRSAAAEPQIEESWHIRIKKVVPRKKECSEYLKKESCIVLISNAPERYSDSELVKTYKGQQVVENSFRELKSPSMASLIHLKNSSRIEALSMLLTFSLLIRAIIQHRLREGTFDHSFAWPTVETKTRITTLLGLMGIELEDLVKWS